MRNTATTSAAPGVLAIVLFVIYGLLPVGVVLFKLPFQYQLTDSGREVNLIPFAGSFGSRRDLGVGEVIENLLVFVPLGVYVPMVRSRWGFRRTLLAVAATSVAFEVIQFAFGIGRADITDVLCNTLGGAVGIGLYAISTKLLGARTNRVLTVVALVVTVLVLAFFIYLRLHSK